MVCVCASTSPAVSGASAQVDLKTVEVTVSNSLPGCLTCTATTIVLNGQGAARLECRGECAVPGSHVVSFGLDQLGEAVKAFDAAGFFDLAERIGDCLDCTVTAFSYRDAGRRHTVEVAGRLPKALSELDLALRNVSAPLRKFMAATPENYGDILVDGVDVNAPVGAERRTLLQYAVAASSQRSVAYLLDRGARVTRDVAEAAGLAAPPLLDVLWSDGGVTAASDEALTMLMAASSGDRVTTVEWLLEHGVDVNRRDAREGKTSRTALMAAAQACANATLDALLTARADATLKDADGKSALDLVPSGGANAQECAVSRKLLGGISSGRSAPRESRPRS